MSKGNDPKQIIPSNTETLISTFTDSKALSETTIKVINIEPFLRNLPEGYHASSHKIATALEHGFNLEGGQTWVDKHTRTYAA